MSGSIGLHSNLKFHKMLLFLSLLTQNGYAFTQPKQTSCLASLRQTVVPSLSPILLCTLTLLKGQGGTEMHTLVFLFAWVPRHTFLVDDSTFPLLDFVCFFMVPILCSEVSDFAWRTGGSTLLQAGFRAHSIMCLLSQGSLSLVFV